MPLPISWSLTLSVVDDLVTTHSMPSPNGLENSHCFFNDRCLAFSRTLTFSLRLKIFNSMSSFVLDLLFVFVFPLIFSSSFRPSSFLFVFLLVFRLSSRLSSFFSSFVLLSSFVFLLVFRFAFVFRLYFSSFVLLSSFVFTFCLSSFIFLSSFFCFFVFNPFLVFSFTYHRSSYPDKSTQFCRIYWCWWYTVKVEDHRHAFASSSCQRLTVVPRKSYFSPPPMYSYALLGFLLSILALLRLTSRAT